MLKAFSVEGGIIVFTLASLHNGYSQLKMCYRSKNKIMSSFLEYISDVEMDSKILENLNRQKVMTNMSVKQY